MSGIHRVYALTDLEPDVPRRLAQAGPLLERLAARMARDFPPALSQAGSTVASWPLDSI
ncbi:hypothetical protein [Streptomyces sparsogenes]|uniref:hypothetical protein n=1 Tax=Streptomyces sparsogenes TaxID=67365 RepID=UPI003F4CD98F